MSGKRKALVVSVLGGFVLGYLAYGLMVALMIAGGVSLKPGEPGENSAIGMLLFVGIGGGRKLYKRLLGRWAGT